ncbi:MAG: hypothetical protein ACLGJB_03825 [Blastocatellia bacterium]
MENEPTGVTDYAIANASLVLLVTIIGKLVKKGIFTREEIKELLKELAAPTEAPPLDHIFDDSVADNTQDIFQLLLETFRDTYEPGDKSGNPDKPTP